MLRSISLQQFMMMVPMMMSSDGSGGAVPMMNPFMPQMPQAFCPMPPQALAAPVAPAVAATAAPAAPSQTPAPAVAPGAPVPGAPIAAPTVMAPTNVPPTAQQQSGQAVPPPQPATPAFPYMMAPQMPGARTFMMPTAMPGQPMMMAQTMPTMGLPQGAMQTDPNGQSDPKDSSSGLNAGSNLAHCA